LAWEEALFDKFSIFTSTTLLTIFQNYHLYCIGANFLDHCPYMDNQKFRYVSMLSVFIVIYFFDLEFFILIFYFYLKPANFVGR
jgi:hypothetical protein